VNYKQKKLTQSDIIWSTERAKDQIDYYSKKALLCLMDKEKGVRQTEALCPLCYYESGRIGGSAMTTTSCSICEKEIHFSNTCTDKLCKTCALGHGLCMHCGAMVNLKIPRKQVLP